MTKTAVPVTLCRYCMSINIPTENDVIAPIHLIRDLCEFVSPMSWFCTVCFKCRRVYQYIRLDLRDAVEITEAEIIETVSAINKTSLYLYAL